MKPSTLRAAIVALLLTGPLQAQVPNLINYQGRVVVGTTNFNSPPTGQFKFALVSAGGTPVWTNSADANVDGVPDIAVSLTVIKGLYAVLLGDTSPPLSMSPIPVSVFGNADLRLRVWFDDGINGSQLLTPDQRLAPTAYLSDGAVTSSKLAAGAVGAAQLAPGTAFSWQSVSGTSQQAQSNTGYTANDPARVTVTLPTAPNVGDTVRVLGAGAGGWSIAPSAGQSVLGGSAVGSSWVPHDPVKGWYFVACSADGSKLVASVVNENLYTSADGGVTWTPRPSAGSRAWNSVASSADGSKLVAVVSAGQVYTSDNSGVSWSPHDSNRNWVAVASSADGVKLVAASAFNPIYTSTNSGVSWTANGAGHYWSAVASSGDGTKLVAVGNTEQIYTSANSGLTWTAHGPTAVWTSVASSDNGFKLVATVSGGQIYTSTDSGANWTGRDSNRAWTQVASSSDGTNLAAVVYGGQVYTSSDSGVTWTARDSVRNWQCIASSADGGNLVAGVYAGQMYTAAQYLTGAQGSTAELQYIGNGQWQAMNQSLIAAGAVGAAQIASGTVGSMQIAAGGVASQNIANNAVGSSQIAGLSIDSTKLADSAVTGAKIGSGQVVKSLNALTDAVTLLAGPNIVLSQDVPNKTLTITANGTISGNQSVLSDGSTIIGNGSSAALSVKIPLNLAQSSLNPIVTGANSGSGKGLSGTSDSGMGVYGSTSISSESSAGVWGESSVSGGTGVVGKAIGISNTGTGVYGASGSGAGVLGGSTSGNGVEGNSITRKGVLGIATTRGMDSAGVWGKHTADGGTAIVARAEATGNLGSTGIYAKATGNAGYFDGNVTIWDIGSVGNAGAAGTKSGKTFFGSSTRQMLNLFGTEDSTYAGTEYGIGVQAATLYFRTNEAFAWFQRGGHSDTPLGPGARGLAPGGTLMTLQTLTPASGTTPASFGLLTVGALTIRGGSDLAEPFKMTDRDIPKGSVVIIDDQHPGNLKLSDRAYDHRVAGIVSGANGIRPGIALQQDGALEGDQNVALSGRVYVRADTSNGRIQPGDLLTTSEIPGHAMKATNHDRAQGAIIGKAMSTLEKGTGMVLVLVTLQ